MQLQFIQFILYHIFKRNLLSDLVKTWKLYRCGIVLAVHL